MDSRSARRSVFRQLFSLRSFRISEPMGLPGGSLSARICRSLSRGLGRTRVARSCGIATLFWAAGVAGSASAGDFLVTSSADSGAGTLRQAMIDAAASGDSANTITFDASLAGQQIVLTSGLPIIRENLTINGSGAAGLTIDGGGAVRPFFVESGTVVINDLVIQNGSAKGGDGGGPGDGGSGGGGLGAGGAIFVRGGNVTVENVTFQNNAATGGSVGTDPTFFVTKSFGGGGLGGNGGADPGVSGNNATGGGGAFDDAPPASSSSGVGSAGGGANGGAGGTPNGGAGGDYGGGGGAGAGGAGGNGGYGGGGGGGFGGPGGAGGFGGGGGSATFGDGGAGGFGGGGGGSRNDTAGVGGFGGGDGIGQMGGGGAGFGGAVFVADGATLTVRNSGLSGGSVQGGTGAVNGSAAGTGIFLQNSGVTFDVTTGNSITVSDTIADAAGNAQPGGVTVTGAGTLTLSGTNTYTGGTTVTGGGTLSISDDVNLGDASGSLTLDNGTLQWTGPSNAFTRTTTLGAGGGTLEITSSGPTWSGTIQGSGALTVAGAGSLFLSGTNTYSGGTVKNSTGDLYVFTDANLGDVSGDFTLNAGRFVFRGGDETFARDFIMGTGGRIGTTQNNITFSGVVSGSGALSYMNFGAAGSLTLDGANTYTGGTIVNAANGTLRLGTTGSLDSTGALTIDNGTFDLNGRTQTVGTFGGSGGILDLNGGDFTTDSAADSIFQGVIQGNGAFTKAGTGELTLSGTNTYIGQTTLNGGTLVISDNANLGDAANGLTFGGGALRILGTTTIDRTTTLNALGGTIDILTGDQGTYSGDISGNGGLTKTGAGLLILSGTNTYLGGTTVSAGTLRGDSTSLQGDIVNNASVVFDQAISGTYAGDMSGSGSFTKQGIGTLILSGTNTYSGGTTITAGTLQGNTASLQGDITNNAALVFDQATDGTFANVISGSGSLDKQGAGRLILSGTNTYTGGTTVSAGTLEGNTTSLQGDITNNAALVFDQQTTGTYADVISGTGSVTKTGAGRLVLSGTNTYTGLTTVDAGNLAVNGSITSSVTVNGGAILSGNGTITGDVANSGSVGPGNSIDTLHVVGNYTQAANGSLDIEIAPGSGNTDVLAVTGTATIDGALNIDSGGNPGFSVNQNYTFLTATGGVSGVFSSVTDDLAFLDAQVNYSDPNAVSIVLILNGTTFANVAQTPNQLAVAGALDTASPTATGDFAVIIQNILGMSDSQARSSFNQLSGEIIASSSSASIEQGQQTLRILADHVRNTGDPAGTIVTARMYSPDRAMAFVNGGSLPQNDDAIQLANYSSGRTSLLARGRTAEETLVQYLTEPTGVARTWDGWIDGYGQQGNFDSNGNASSVSYGVGGTTFGAGYYLDNQTVVGVLGGYADSTVRGGGSGADQAKVNTTQVGVYARTGFGNHYLLGVATYGNQDYATSRAVNIGGVPTPTSADYNADQAGLLFEYGQNRTFGSFVVQPLASVQYINQQTDSFAERGAGGATLNVAGRTDDSLRAAIGARFMMPILTAGNHMLVPEIHGRYMHELLGGSQNIGATFTGAPGTPFTIQGVNAGESFFLYGFGATYGLTNHISLYGHYLGQATAQLISNTGTGGLQITW